MAANHRQLLAEAQQLLRKQQFQPAENLYRQILALRPHDTDALFHLGILYNQTKRYEDAIALFQQIMALKPYALDALGNLGVALAAAGRHEEAIAAFKQFLKYKPEDALTHYNLGISYKSSGHFEEAVTSYRRALEIKPAYADAHFNLGNALRAQRKPVEAIAAFQEALRIDPRHAEACNNLGHTLKEEARIEEAIEHFRRAMAMRPLFTDAIGALADALRDVGQVQESIVLSRFLIEKNPDDRQVHSALLFAQQYLTDINPQAVLEEHVRWAQHHLPGYSASQDVLPSYKNDRVPDRRLRVGYVSPDFREHSVAFFLENLLAFHDPKQVDLFCYSNVIHPDSTTTRFQQYAHHWKDTAKLTSEELADLIRLDQIDILVDLSGHTLNDRLHTFSLKPAPVQVSYLGYVNTTGVTQIDYRFVDEHTDPPGMTDAFHTEQLIRLPRTFACYRPPDSAPVVGSLPAYRNDFVTFACLGAVPKINAALLKTWAGIMSRISHARLLFASSGFSSSAARARVLTILSSHGIAPERIEFLGFQTFQAYLDLHQRIDILLDTYPVGGHTITCHALWMGVPTVSQAGANYVSRLSASVLFNLQLPELVAMSSEEYENIAVALANDLPRLATLRATMRSRMQASSLMDYPTFARNVEAAYRTLWQRWCDQATTPHSQRSS